VHHRSKLPPVSSTPAANFATTFASFVDTGGIFATGINNTGGKFATGVNDTCGRLLRPSSELEGKNLSIS
jgi:hypothetical protein